MIHETLKGMLCGIAAGVLEKRTDLIANWQPGTERPSLVDGAVPALRKLAMGEPANEELSEQIIAAALADEAALKARHLDKLALATRLVGRGAFCFALGKDDAARRAVTEAQHALSAVEVLATPQ